ncbi:ABC transporter [Roseateles aquatilis]|uniref:ABC transporter n=1 Tax=Roseateles aquatilis TaxID=431061 RepID=A0A246J0Y7_9BURK|nr:ATP-binding cassette domain-containing protein [Roseateles aquatilis]OWQ86225.1 ABC transporter [Roseateles aquatilis]
MIEVAGLSKSYWVHRREQHFGAVVASLFRRRTEEVVALRDVHFSIRDGERVGFLGPNGAGKTTLMKVLCGLLHPSGGSARVDGYVPYERAPDYLRRMTMVMGGKSQLIWDLPPADSFEMIRAVYGIPSATFRVTLGELVDLLALGPLMHKPTRQLSLGERMRCEFAAALLHQPKVLFLDEPTIGLDAGMQAAVRDFILAYNRAHGATVLLTSHYMQDVAAICPRVVVINHGTLVYDGDLRDFVRTVKPEKVVSFRWSGSVLPGPLLAAWALRPTPDGRIEARVGNERVPELVRAVMALPEMADLMIEDPSLDDVLREVYGQAGVEAAA